MKIIILVSIFFSQIVLGQEITELSGRDISSGGGKRVLDNGVGSGGGSRVVDGGIGSGGGASRIEDISGGGGRFVNPDVRSIIQLMKVDRQVDGKLQMSSALEDLKLLGTSAASIQRISKILQLRIVTPLNEISEITLKDGTVLKVEELLERN